MLKVHKAKITGQNKRCNIKISWQILFPFTVTELLYNDSLFPVKKSFLTNIPIFLYYYLINFIKNTQKYFILLMVMKLNSFLIRLILQSLPAVLFLFPLLTLIRVLYISVLHKPKDMHREIIFILFNLWIAVMISLTMLSEIHITEQGFMIGTSDLTGINLHLFRVFRDIQIITFKNGYWPYFWINLIGNLLLFIPFGFLLPMLWKSCSLLKVLFFSFIFSSLIEIIQLVLPRGTDIDDVWLNCSGAIIGWSLFQLIRKVKKTN